MKELSNSGHMACEVTLRSLRYTFTTPRYQSVLRKASIGVLDLHKGELDATITEFVYQIDEFSL